MARLPLDEFAGGGRLRQDLAVGIGDGRLDVGHGGKAILYLLQGGQVEEVSQVQVFRFGRHRRAIVGSGAAASTKWTILDFGLRILD